MAEAASLGVAKSVLGQLSAPALQEFHLLWNSKKDLQRLEQTILTITDYLHDAEQQESENHLVWVWLSRLRDVLYDAGDFFSAVAYRALREKAMADNSSKKEVFRFFSISELLGFILKTAHDVKDLRERMDDIAKDMSQFNFTIKPTEIEEFPVRLRDRKETHSFVDAEDIIGRDQDKEEIMKLLLLGDYGGQRNSRNLSVISVIGFGGLGKTALAQLVFNDARVQMEFELCLWVCINYFSDLRKALMTILTSNFEYKPQDNDSINKLQNRLRESIEGKKYLLVLDDVWDEDPLNWDKLKCLFRFGGSGSKILVTTRSRKVARCLDSIKPFYELNVLSEESAWGLFVKRAFQEGELSSSDSDELIPLRKKIVRKCGYAPLALITVGSMLRCKEKEKGSWLSFVEKELPKVLSHDKDRIMQALKFSYNDLPPSLKLCFAYCSLFPKDYTFDKDELVNMWLAQGFLEPYAEMSLEEVGDEYFFYMVDRCFFQEVEMYTKKGCPGYTCKMNYLLHDLAIQVAGLESKCFLEDVIEGSTLRHISVYCNPNFLLDYCGKSSRSKMVRTLLFSDASAELIHAKSLNSFPASFKVLRMLRLPSLKVEKLPDSIGELIHLRYLDLSQNEKLNVLPNSICKLYHLQTLKFEGCTNLKELPSRLGELASLRHLFLSRCHRLDSVPSGLAALTSLVTLDQLIVHHRNGGLRYLGQLDNLCGVVEIELPVMRWLDCIEDARKSKMSRKHKLNGMKINWKTSNAGEMEKEEAKAVLEGLEPNTNLQYLKIKGYVADTLSSWFSILSNLKKLVLEECTVEYLEDVTYISSSSSLFPCLEVLKMKMLCNLKGWWRVNAPISALPCLPRVSEVVIESCPNLMEIMPFFGKEIENLKLREVNGKLVSKLLSTPAMSCSSECHHYTKLQELSLIEIKDLKCLPEGWIRHLTALKLLYISGCRELSWVSSCGLAYLTSLEELRITCYSKVRLEDKDDDKLVEMNTGLGIMPWKELQGLRTLHVDWQSHLQEGLQYLASLEDLTIRYYEANQVEADNEDMKGGELLWKFGFGRLHSLNINFDGIGCSFPKWIRYLRLLKYLELCNCEELTSMSWEILANMKLHTLYLRRLRQVSRTVDDSVAGPENQFNSLLKLSIEIVEEDNWIHDIPWKLFPSLRTLLLHDIRNFRSLPDGIQHLTTLEELYTSMSRNCEGIKAIPKWMINLSSLRRLNISGCSPELAERCKRFIGVDWPLISHIPHIEIRENTSKLNCAQTFKQSMDNQEVEVFDEEKDNQEAEVKKETEWSKVGTSSQEMPQHLANETEDTKGKRKIGIQWEDEDQYKAGAETFEQSMDNQEVDVSDEEKDNQEVEMKKETEWSKVGTSSQEMPQHLANETDEDLPPKARVMEKMKDSCSILFLLPENYEIEKDTLIQLWMAGQYIGDEREGEEDFGAVLKNECLVHSGINFMTGKDLYRINITKISELVVGQKDIGNFYLKWDNKYQQNSGRPGESIQHVSLVCNVDIDGAIVPTLLKLNKLRTLLFLGNHGQRVQQHTLDQLFLSLKNVQALDLSRTQIEELPSSIDRMIHIRYLDLSWTLINWLPDTLCYLTELQTLKLRGCSNLHELPAQLKKLTRLRHLDFDVLRQLKTMPKKIRALVNLQTLSAFLVGTEDGCKIQELKNLNKLAGNFCIAELENVEDKGKARKAALHKKKNLKKLELRWTASEISGKHHNSDAILKCLRPSTSLEELQILCYEGLAFPSWVSNPEFNKLTHITFYKCKYVSELPLIEHLPSLMHLHLIRMNNIEKIGRHGATIAFSKLEKLEIDEMQRLKAWDWKKINNGDFESLTQLTINDCPELHELDIALHLSSLKHLEIRDCPKVLESLNNIEFPISLEVIVDDRPFNQKEDTKGKSKIEIQWEDEDQYEAGTSY